MGKLGSHTKFWCGIPLKNGHSEDRQRMGGVTLRWRLGKKTVRIQSGRNYL